MWTESNWPKIGSGGRLLWIC